MTNDSRHENAFDVVRLLLAFGVVFTHSHALGGFDGEPLDQFSKGQTTVGSLAVWGFFGLSGYLVTISYLTRQYWRSFALARLLRIMPGLVFALVLSAFVFAPVISYFSPADNSWNFAGALKYVAGNALVRVHYWHVGDELSGLPFTESLNGSLWSLWPELLCYGMVLAAGLAGLFRVRAVGAIALFLILLITHAAISTGAVAPRVPTALTLTGFSPLFVAFASGMVLAVFRDHVTWSRTEGLFWLVMTLALLRFGGWHLAGPLVLTLALLHLAQSLRLRLPGDLSYGTYLLHFPVLHMLAAAGLNKTGLTAYLLLALVLVTALAALSWQLIEKPSLRLKLAPPATTG